MILWLTSCALHQATPLGPVERLDAFAIEARGNTMAGMAMVASDGEDILGTEVHELLGMGCSGLCNVQRDEPAAVTNKGEGEVVPVGHEGSLAAP